MREVLTRAVARADLDRSTAGWCATALTIFLGFAVWLALPTGGVPAHRVVSDLAFVVVPLLAAASCADCARRRAASRRGWMFVAIGCAVWSSGSMAWAVAMSGRGSGAAMSYADLAYCLWAVPMCIGIASFPRAVASIWSRWRVSLDTLVIAASLLFLSAVVVLQPLSAGRWSPAFTDFDAAAYPLADISIVSVLLSRATVIADARRLTWILLCGGLLVQIAGDGRYLADLLHGSYHLGGPLDAAWVAAFLLIGISARVAVASDPNVSVTVASSVGGLGQQLLPYGPIALAAWAFASGDRAFAQGGRYFWASCLLAVIVMVRMVFVVSDHARLTRGLAQAVAAQTAELTERDRWWRAMVRNLSDIIVVLDRDVNVIWCSPAMVAALGWAPGPGMRVPAPLDLVHPDDIEAVTAVVAPVVAGEHRQGRIEARIRNPSGGWWWYDVMALGQIQHAGLDGAVLTLHDVTDRHALHQELEYLAFHDVLSGLPNRALLMRELERVRIAGVKDVSLLLLDLDDFKVINDTHGHQAGDEVLRAISQRLRDTVRSDDVVARLGGDEFAVLLRCPPDEVLGVAAALVDTVGEPVEIDDRRFVVRASVGVVHADGGVETGASLLAHADIALYEAKSRDRGGVVTITGSERQAAANKMHLRQLIANPDLSQFTLVYQPLVAIEDGAFRAVEALLRWHHPEFGTVSPNEFIPLAEHGGSIDELGWHVFESACSQLRLWSERAPGMRLGLGVNVSVLQLHRPGFVDRIEELLVLNAIAPDQLVIEITEQALARDFETAVNVVAQMREVGMSVAVDDFGTGYSSLRYLDRFAADVVKIDRSFVGKLSTSDHTRQLIRSVISMAHSLDMQTVAEGIETGEQLEILQDLGCEIGQGYLFSKPVGPDRVHQLLERRAPALLIPPSQLYPLDDGAQAS